MIHIHHISFEGEESFEPKPIVAAHPFEVVATIGGVFVPLGAAFVEVTETSVIMQAQEEGCSTVTTFVGSPRDMLPVLSFIYHYMKQAEKPSDISPSDMLFWIQTVLSERGSHPSMTCEVPPIFEAEELRRATLYACDIFDEDDVSAGLQVDTHIIALAAEYYQVHGLPFVHAVKEIVASGQFEFDP